MLKGFVQDDGAISGSVGTDAHYHGKLNWYIIKDKRVAGRQGQQ